MNKYEQAIAENMEAESFNMRMEAKANRELAESKLRPSIMLIDKMRITNDVGREFPWSALTLDGINIVGVGNSPAEAMLDFDRQWENG